QGMEHAADRAQQFAVLGRAPPYRQQLVEVADLLLEFLQEDLADLVVDFLAGRFETGDRRARAGVDGGGRGLGGRLGRRSGSRRVRRLRLGGLRLRVRRLVFRQVGDAVV